jgi:hypothetical protein
MISLYEQTEFSMKEFAGSYYFYSKADRAALPVEVIVAFEAVPWSQEPNGCCRSRHAFYRNKENGQIIQVVDYESWCGDCGRREWTIFMVWKHLWVKYGNGLGMLCQSCFAKRLGRPLTLNDLNTAPCNQEFTSDEDLILCGK